MIREPSIYCRLTQKVAFIRKVNALAGLPNIQWDGHNFWNKKILIATPLFNLFSIINWRTE